MSYQYASQLPTGSSNHLDNIAIVGVSGSIGKHITEALLKSGKHKITAITRIDSKSEVPSGVKAAKVNYDDHASLVEVLKGNDLLIITMSMTAPQGTQQKLANAAKDAGIHWVMPNEYGYGANNADEQFGKDTGMGPGIVAMRRHLESLGLNYIGLSCGFWYQYSLASSEVSYGFDFSKRSLTVFDDGNIKHLTSTKPQCGRAIAKVLSLPVLPQDEHDTSLTVSKWRNSMIYIKSFQVSQRDMLAAVNRVMGLKDSDWTITHENVHERFNRGQEMLKQGNRFGFGVRLYSRIFFPDAAADYSSKLQNDLLGLPEEDFDQATKEAVDIALSGGSAH